MARRPEVFDRLVQLRSNDARPWLARGRALADAGEWARAAEDYATMLDLKRWEFEDAGTKPSTDALRAQAAGELELAALRLLAGDEAGHRELCVAMNREWEKTPDEFIGSMVARAMTLASGETIDWSAVVRLAELAVNKSPKTAWYVSALGAAHYRAGNDAEAVRRLEESLQVHPAWVGRGQNYVFLALATHRQGKADEAREWLKKTEAWLAETERAKARNRFGYAASAYLNDWLSVRVLVREARAALGANAGGGQIELAIGFAYARPRHE
jgi:Flp pilus assembly protein TadD